MGNKSGRSGGPRRCAARTAQQRYRRNLARFVVMVCFLGMYSCAESRRQTGAKANAHSRSVRQGSRRRPGPQQQGSNAGSTKGADDCGYHQRGQRNNQPACLHGRYENGYLPAMARERRANLIGRPTLRSIRSIDNESPNGSSGCAESSGEGDGDRSTVRSSRIHRASKACAVSSIHCSINAPISRRIFEA